MSIKNCLFIFGLLLNLISVLGRPSTVQELDVSQYTGRWYQVYGAHLA